MRNKIFNSLKIRKKKHVVLKGFYFLSYAKNKLDEYHHVFKSFKQSQIYNGSSSNFITCDFLGNPNACSNWINIFRSGLFFLQKIMWWYIIYSSCLYSYCWKLSRFIIAYSFSVISNISNIITNRKSVFSQLINVHLIDIN